MIKLSKLGLHFRDYTTRFLYRTAPNLPLMKIPKSWSKHNLPEELWPEILSRLPVKSLLRFRCVSISWRALIDDDRDFARSHLTRFSNNRLQSHLCVVQGKFREEECVIRCSKTFKLTARLGPFPFRTSPTTTEHRVRIWEIVCSIDGVFILTDRNFRPIAALMLWNPSIRKARVLPPMPHVPGGQSSDLGLGFDRSINDYKAVRLRFVGAGFNNLHSIAIYTLRSDSWKIIQFQGKGSCSEWRWHSSSLAVERIASFRGAVYFIGLTLNLNELVSFDTGSEVFASTILPGGNGDVVNSHGFGLALCLIDGGSSLAVISYLTTPGFVWVLEAPGADIESASWTKRYTFSLSIPDPCTSVDFLCLTKSGNMFFTCRKAVTSYNVETHAEKTVLKKSASMLMFPACGYIESLILLK